VDYIIREVQLAIQGGGKEAVLSGVHLGSWGADLGHGNTLSALIRILLEKTDIDRIRLSSLDPWNVDPPLVEMLKSPRVARHLHLPLQSGSPAVLKRMGRKITPGQYANLLQTVSRAVPGVAVTTDVIAGFPGETDQEFAENAAFIKDMGFAGGHVFPYSSRPGTPAAGMPDQIPHPVRKKRAAQLRKLFKESRTAFQSQFLGETLPVLWEVTRKEGERWIMSGISDNYLRITTRSRQNLYNHLTPVRVTAMQNRGMAGVVCDPMQGSGGDEACDSRIGV
jgi:threonylcarbamoyladenosine tRNA methylthiotransferase MtaB